MNVRCMPRSVLCGFGAAVTVLLAAGCSGPAAYPSVGDSAVSTRTLPPDVAARPDITVADVEYRRQAGHIMAILRDLGGLKFPKGEYEISEGGCVFGRDVPYNETRTYMVRGFDPFPWAQWAAIERAISDYVRPLGFTKYGTLSSGSHEDHEWDNPTTKQKLIIAGEANFTNMALDTACHPFKDFMKQSYLPGNAARSWTPIWPTKGATR